MASHSPFDEEHRLAQPAAVGCGMRVGDVGDVVQVPGVGRAETGHAERFDQSFEVSGWPERRIGRRRGGAMRCTVADSLARDQSRR